MEMKKKGVLDLFKRERPLTYKIYNYLKKNAVGYEKRVKSSEIMEKFNIRDNKTFRAYIENIRDSEILQKIVCSEAGSNGGYWIATNNDEVVETLQHLYKRSMKMLKTYSILKRKSKLNNQMRLKLSKYEKEIYESLMEVKEDE